MRTVSSKGKRTGGLLRGSSLLQGVHLHRFARTEEGDQAAAGQLGQDGARGGGRTSEEDVGGEGKSFEGFRAEAVRSERG